MENITLTSETIETMSELAGFNTPELKQAVLFGVGLAFGTTCGAMISAIADAELKAQEERANRKYNPSMHVVANDEP